MSGNSRQYPSPVPNVETEFFWEKARQRKLFIKHCKDCSTSFWYPRETCPFCHGQQTEWIESTGIGEIYSFSVMRRVQSPYVIAYIVLDDGPCILSNINNCNIDSLEIGQKVQVDFVDTADGDFKLPVFIPV